MTQITEAQKKLLSKMQRGDRKRIADTLGIATNTVYRVWNGFFKNDKVWELTAQIAAERDKTTKKIIQTAESLSTL